jgi:hypothetical protein
MNQDYIAMYVSDLKTSKTFFIKYFEASSNEPYNNFQTGSRTYFLSFGNGACLEIMNQPQMDAAHNSLTHNGLIHVTFSIGCKKNEDSLTQPLRVDGFETISGPCVTGNSCYKSCVCGLDGCKLEITK